MNFNSAAAAVLIVGISAMVISKVGDILVPETRFTYEAAAEASSEAAESEAPAQKAPVEPSVSEALANADVAKGQKLLQSKCKSCHSWNKGGRNGTGPNLYGVVGRKKGAIDGYSYSSAMKSAGTDWTYESLYEFLKRPSAVVKGTKMAYRLRKYQQRADVIAFLRTLSDSPLPLPEIKPKNDGDEQSGSDADKKSD